MEADHLSKRKLYKNDLGPQQREGKTVFFRHHSAVFITFDSLPYSKSQERDSDWLSSDHMLTSPSVPGDERKGRASRNASASKRTVSTLEGTKTTPNRER